MNVRVRILSALQKHISEGKPDPTILVISISTAMDFEKLGYNELGPISTQLLKHGYKHLEKIKFYGLKIRIDPKCSSFHFE